MGSQLVVDLNSLTKETARVFAGMILAFVGYEDTDISGVALDPAAIFGQASQSGVVDTSAPHIEIPPPLPQTLQVVPPPPPPPVPSVPLAVTAPLSGGAILDKDGLPWDARIHASSKATNADGTWRLKRGVDKTEVDSVTAELRRVMAAPGPQLVQAPPAAAAPPPPAPVNEAPDARNQYVELIGRASSAQGAGRITATQVNECLMAVGVESMHGLANRLDLVPAAAALIDGIIAGKNA